MRLMLFLPVLGSVVLTAGAQVLLKIGASGPELQKALAMGAWLEALTRAALSLPILLGLACFGVSVLLWIFVLTKIDVSVAYPFVSLGIVITVVAGHFLLGESLSPLRVAGVCAIVMGVIAVALSA